MSYVSVFINAIVVALMAVYVYENERRIGEMSVRHDLKVLALERKLVDEIKAGIDKLTEIENQLLKSQEKEVTYVRWGKTTCDGSNTETIYSGQVGGGHYSHSGASVNYICLPNNPDVAQPLKLHDHYAYLYGGEYEIFGHNQPKGIRSDILNHDVACAACLAKGKHHQS
ncbi:unnamed protein product [Mytilus coruscus]|uniref:Uncharacterized protein n=1 Tax=Mytilus coruscus TaxID=42192 RepID=A0A6J8A8W7_MYTCO|nr:unnamed protein product [Mytilus coruscus]